ncbi:polyglutamate synthase [Aphelenchoides avenae]|nr:polyglutamate synthase [Aphelenchus avenae]
MHPENVPAIASADVDCCVLANNHVLDWGVKGLEETLDVLQRSGLRTAGAGRTDKEAAAPAVIDVPAGTEGQKCSTRVLVFAYGMESSGVPSNWAATSNSPGVNFLPDLSEGRVEGISRQVADHRRPGDVVVLSIHWGPNWGYQVPKDMRRFAHKLIDAGAADIIHGHSSHHPMGIEVYRDKPILYGCGDFLNDYEGISGHEEYRSELTLMYFPVVNRKDAKTAGAHGCADGGNLHSCCN